MQHLGGVGVVTDGDQAVGAAQHPLPARARSARLLGLQAPQPRHRVQHRRAEVHWGGQGQPPLPTLPARPHLPLSHIFLPPLVLVTGMLVVVLVRVVVVVVVVVMALVSRQEVCLPGPAHPNQQHHLHNQGSTWSSACRYRQCKVTETDHRDFSKTQKGLVSSG